MAPAPETNPSVFCFPPPCGRTRSLSDPDEIAYYLAHAPVGIEIDELARIAGNR